MGLLEMVKSFKEFLLEEITAEELTNIYELNYMYDMMRISSYTGIPERRDNLIRNIEDKAIGICDDVLEQLNDIFYDWLESHALTSAKSWAKSRAKDLEEYGDSRPELAFVEPFHDYLNYKYKNSANPPRISYDFNGRITGLPKEIDEMVEEYVFHIQEHNLFEDCALSDWFETKLIEFKDDFETELSGMDEDDDKTQVLDNIKRANDRDYTLLIDFEFVNRRNMEFGIEEGLIDIVDLAEDIYEYVCFPLWFEYWKKQGIVQTRDRINITRENMLKALHDDDLTEKFKIINIALNAVHQTGDMIDYVEREHNQISKQLLNDLSNMNVDKLNSKLKMQGFHVDKTKKWEPFTESTADEIKLKSVENQIGNKQKDVDNKTTQKDRLNNDIQNMEKRGIKTPSDANRMERLKKQISDLDKRIKTDTDQMNKIYNTYTKSKTSMAPILGKTLGTIDDISKQKDDEKDFFKDDVNYKNRQLGFNFSTGGSNLDRIEKSMTYEKESIESKIREIEKRNKELSEEITKLEKEMEKAKKEISRIGDPNDIKLHSNDEYNERNRTIRIENLRKYNHIVRNNPDKIKRNVDEISKNTKEISKLKSDLIKNFPEN